MLESAADVDEALTDSFPASDPPFWVPGTAAVRQIRPTVERLPAIEKAVVPAPARPDVTWSARAWRHLRSTLMAAGIVMFVPIFIVSLPLLLAWRAVVALTGWRR